MKPLQLTMSAFGSYAGTEVISFDRVNRGIFLITGDTGAGKTTIFDAIVYALYDETSGGRRSGDMMRSQYAAPDVETYVELVFYCNGAIHRIRRNPNFLRTSKRKDANGNLKFTEQKARVALYMPDGTEWPGNRTQVNQKIVELIGLDRTQFTKTAMLAQGEFLELLQANSEERKRIFSQIFDTNLYQLLQKKLNDRTNLLRQTLEDLEQEIRLAIGQIEGIEETGHQDQWDALALQTYTGRTERIVLAESVNEKLQQEHMTKRDALEALERKQQQAVRREERGKQINQDFAELEQVQQAFLALDHDSQKQKLRKEQIHAALQCQKIVGTERVYQKCRQEVARMTQQLQEAKVILQTATFAAEEAEQRLQACEAVYKARQPFLLQKRSRLLDLEPLFVQLQEALDAQQAIQTQKSQVQQRLAELTENQLQLEEARKTLLQRLEQCSGAQVQQLELEQRVLQIREAGRKKQDLYVHLKKWETLKQDWESALACRMQSVEADNNAAAEYNAISNIWVQEQAGILAGTLQEGQPCPVCGSLTHPHRAVCSQKDITQAQVEAARMACEQARQMRLQQESTFEQVNNAYQELTGQICSQGSDLTGTEYQPKEGDAVIFYREVQDLARQCKEMQAQLAVLQEQAHFYQAGQEKQARLEIKRQQLADQQARLQQQLTDISTKAGSARTLAEGIRNRLLDPDTQGTDARLLSREDAVQKRRVLEQQLADLDVQLEEAQQRAKGSIARRDQCAGMVQTSQETLQRYREEDAANQQVFLQALAEHGFASEEGYQAAKCTASELAYLEETCSRYEQDWIRIKERMQQLQERTSGMHPVDLQHLGMYTRQLQEMRKEQEQQINRLVRMIEGNEKLLLQLKEKTKQEAVLTRQYDMIADLSRTVNGNLKGSGRIGLETYVQRYYFQEVLQAANKRLLQMNGRQFLLQCRSLDHLAGNTNEGLDIDVYSLVTDSVRDVKTLSGGESFMAALAMALGLSDVIQGRAGAVQLDTMFIDEGFGSLDEESRAQAIGILNQLAGGNRLIGIISHVRELKEQLDRQLVVKRTKSGSKSMWNLY